LPRVFFFRYTPNVSIDASSLRMSVQLPTTKHIEEEKSIAIVKAASTTIS